MKVADLISNAPKSVADHAVLAITQDSRAVGAGTLFFAIEGTARDGHDFIADAITKGAAAVVVRAGHSKLDGIDDRSRLVEVADPRAVLGLAASAFHAHPSRQLLVCGVTGTNGKTTSTYLLEALLSAWKKKPAVIGTVENRLGSYKIEATHTTPDAVGLQRLFADFLARGADAVAMEVSSHALDQKRTWGTQFSAALFTNLTQDHLDYHADMEDYFAAKTRLFTDYEPRVRAIHADDAYGARLIEICKSANLPGLITFGKRGCDVSYEKLTLSAAGMQGELLVKGEPLTIDCGLLGGFNAQNLAGAAAVCSELGMPLELIAQALKNFSGVPGRMQTVPNNKGFTVVVDYAHTPDALEKALKTLRELQPHRLHCVFGCGGDRDPGKRPIMGEIAERLADDIYVTSDNPRTENPGAIIDAIVKGFKNPKKAQIIEDRRAAIGQAVHNLRPGEILLIAGKGHEDYQIIGTKKLPFDDRKVALENLGNGTA